MAGSRPIESKLEETSNFASITRPFRTSICGTVWCAILTPGRLKLQVSLTTPAQLRTHVFACVCFPQPLPRPNQKSSGQPQSRGGRLDVGSAHKPRWRRQERIIQQLVHDNGVLQRKVAGFQVILRADDSMSSV